MEDQFLSVRHDACGQLDPVKKARCVASGQKERGAMKSSSYVFLSGIFMVFLARPVSSVITPPSHKLRYISLPVYTHHHRKQIPSSLPCKYPS